MRKLITVPALNCIIALFLLVGCQTIQSKDGNLKKDSSQKQAFALRSKGVSSELYQEAVKEQQKAKEELQQLNQDKSLSGTAKRILAEAEVAEEQGNEELYLAKIQEYRQLLNDEPIRRAAESWVLEGRVLFSQLRLTEAQQALEESIKLDSNPEYLLLLAEYLQWNNQYKSMEEVCLQAISRIKNQDSLDEILLAKAFSMLSMAYLLKGNYNLAIDHLYQALEMRKKLLGEEHPDVANSLNDLAGLYQSKDRYSKAEQLYKQALEMRKKLLGEEHPDVANSLNNLAGLYELQGRYSEAEPLMQQALEISEQALGKNHPNTNNIRGNYEELKEKKQWMIKTK